MDPWSAGINRRPTVASQSGTALRLVIIDLVVSFQA
jgi:hypothetical protein